MKRTLSFIAAIIMVLTMLPMASASAGVEPVIEGRAGVSTMADIPLTNDNLSMVNDAYKAKLADNSEAMNAAPAQAEAFGINTLSSTGRISFTSVVSYPLYVNTDGSLYYYSNERESYNVSGVSRPLVKRKLANRLYLDNVYYGITGTVSNATVSANGSLYNFVNRGSYFEVIGWDYDIRIDYKTGTINTYELITIRY